MNSCGGGGGSNGGGGGGAPGLVADAKLLVEHNATDEDTGFQGFADAEPWNQLTIVGPGGQPIVTVTAQGGLNNFGLTELFFETSEPANAEVPIADVLARLEEGDYTFTGAIVDEGDSSASTRLTHDIPAGPVILTPVDGSRVVLPADVIVSWEPVTEDINGAAVTIVGYQVVVEKDEEPQFPQGFARSLFSVHVPAAVTTVTVPAEFMENDACYKCEVLAIEESGNQTISAVEFDTGPGCVRPAEPEPPTPQLAEAKLLIEHNATDEDTGFQGFADGDPWKQLTIRGPDGQLIVTVTAQGGLNNFGLTELFFETSEPANAEVPIADVLARLPEGVYTFTADMVDGGPSELTKTLTHTIPAGPVLLTPVDGSTVDPNNVVVSWEAVSTDINGTAITIVGYQVIVEKDEVPQFPQGFARSLFSVHVPAAVTSITVSKEFMEAGAPYQYEVLAIEESGNQTLSSAAFETQ
jgi:hypothetical protein